MIVILSPDEIGAKDLKKDSSPRQGGVQNDKPFGPQNDKNRRFYVAISDRR